MPGIETLSFSSPELFPLKMLKISHLILLIARYTRQQLDLLLCISESQLDPATFDFLNSKVQVHLIRLLGEDDYSEFENTVHQLRKTSSWISARITSLHANINSTLLSMIPALLTEHPSTLRNHLNDLEQVYVANRHCCELQANINSTLLSTIPALLTEHPSPLSNQLSELEEFYVANRQVTELAERIRRILKKISEGAILLDASEKFDVAYWELPTLSNTTIESLPERLPADQIMGPPAISSSQETVFRIYPRAKVEKHDLEEGGRYRGE